MKDAISHEGFNDIGTKSVSITKRVLFKKPYYSHLISEHGARKEIKNQ